MIDKTKTNYSDLAKAEIENEFFNVAFFSKTFAVSTEELEKKYDQVPIIMFFGGQRFLFNYQTKDSTAYIWDSSYQTTEVDTTDAKKEVKHYYHMGERVGLGGGHTFPQYAVWVPSNRVKLASPEFYKELVEREKQIIAETGLPGFHFPFECEELPPNKILINPKDESTDSTTAL